jgi:hypothetical protein
MKKRSTTFKIVVFVIAVVLSVPVYEGLRELGKTDWQLMVDHVKAAPNHELLDRIEALDKEMTAMRQQLLDSNKDWDGQTKIHFADLRRQRRAIYDELRDRNVAVSPDMQYGANGLVIHDEIAEKALERAGK